MLKVVALPFSAHDLVDMVKHLNCIVSQYKNLIKILIISMGRPVEIECNPKNTHRCNMTMVLKKVISIRLCCK